MRGLEEVKDGSIGSEAWKMAKNPENYKDKSEQINGVTWMRVATTIDDFELVQEWVASAIRKDPDTGILATGFVTVTKTTSQFEIIASKNKFKAHPIKWDIEQTRGSAEFKEIIDGVQDILSFAKKQIGE